MSINGAAAQETTNNRDGVGDVATLSLSQLNEFIPDVNAGADERGNMPDNPAADFMSGIAGIVSPQETKKTETAPAPVQEKKPTTEKAPEQVVPQGGEGAPAKGDETPGPGGEQPVIDDDMKFTVRNGEGQDVEITGKQMRELVAASATVEGANLGAKLTAETVNAAVVEIATQLNAPAVLTQMNTHAQALNTAEQKLEESRTQLRQWQNEVIVAQRDGEADRLATAQTNVNICQENIDFYKEQKAGHQAALETARGKYGQTTGELSVKVVDKFFPDMAKTGLMSMASEMQKVFGLPADVGLEYMHHAPFALLVAAGLTQMRTLGKGAQALAKTEQVPKSFILNTGASAVDGSTKTPARPGADPQRGAALVEHSKQLLKDGDPMNAMMAIAHALGHVDGASTVMGFDNVIPPDLPW